MENIGISPLIVFIIIVVVGVFGRITKSRGIIDKKLERFATQYGLAVNYANDEIFLEGTVNGRSLTIETMTVYSEARKITFGVRRGRSKHTILLMKMAINHLPHAYLKLERFPYLTLPFIFKEDGIYIRLQDRQEPTNLVRILNVEEDEVIPGVLFDVQSDPHTLVSALFEQDTSLKSQLVESFYSADDDTIYSIEIKSGQIILEKGPTLSTDESLEMLVETMSRLATITEQLQQ